MLTSLRLALVALLCIALPAVARQAESVSPPGTAALAEAAMRIDEADRQSAIDADLWQRIRRGFAMNDLPSPLVQEQELWYANRPDYMQRFVERGSRYLYHIVTEIERRGLPTEIALLPIIESAFNPQAYSRAQAAGMWQFIPSTGKLYGLSQDWLADNRRDVLLSTNAALDYLEKLYGMFHSWELAFAAYNCGEGCVGRAIAANARKGLPTDYIYLRLPRETQYYVPKLIAVKNIVLSPESYGIALAAVANRPYFATVSAPEKIDVKLAARLAEMAEGDFAALNPAFTKPVAASGTGYFLVPTEKAAVFRENLALYRTLNGPLVSWKSISAKRGESVDAVARKHGMTASYLRATNGPFKERKGRFTQPATFMAPLRDEASAINRAFEQKVALKREQATRVTTDGDDGPIVKPILPRESLQRAAFTTSPPANAATSAAAAPVASPPDAAAREPASEYAVQRGDTLFSIAKRANLPLNELKTLNGLSANTIAVGQVLKFPAGTTLGPPPPRLSEEVLAAISSAVSATRTYVVRTGDTLFAIAKRFGTSVDNIRKWNRLGAKTPLRVGQKLRVGSA